MSFNVPADEYDSLQHRVLIPDCENDALLALDLATGERSVFIDDWGWSEPDSTTCVLELSVQHESTTAYAKLVHGYPDPDGYLGYCNSTDFVSIDTVTGEATLLWSMAVHCCEDCGALSGYDFPLLDQRNDRFLYVEADGGADWREYLLDMAPSEGGLLEYLEQLSPAAPCNPAEDEGCTYRPSYEPIAMLLDPADPDNRLLVFARDTANPEAPFVEVRDLATGDLIETFAIQTTWGDLSTGSTIDVSADIATQRVLVTTAGGVPGGDTAWPVIAIDSTTGAQTLLHDGDPTAAEPVFPQGCRPSTALDKRTGRLILIGESGGDFDCPGNDFALDLATGTLSPL
jgi:hypothetical protein